MKPHEETVLVTILTVTEQRTRPDWAHPAGRRRFEIDAERVAAPDIGQSQRVWCSTLDPLAASLCLRARETGKQLLLTVRMVPLYGRFGSSTKVFNLVHVENVSDEVHV